MAAAAWHQQLVAARQYVGQRRFPCAMAVGDVDVGFALGGEQFREIGEQAVGQFQHLFGIDIERRAMHRLQHLVGHGGRSRDGQKFPARANGHLLVFLIGKNAESSA
jgi:hypothetical protein